MCKAISGSLMALVLIAATPAASRAGDSRMLVICAPGYPATTEQAQETLDAFAAAVAEGAGWKKGSLGAVFLAAEQAGLERVGQADAALALVPLEFLLLHGERLGLEPLLQAVQESGPDEIWSLVAKKGAVTSSASLAGWQVTGRAGYAPAFVRGAILGDWGPLPADTQISFTERPLSALRKAAAGEKVAVVLDREQAASLGTLPFGADLEVVTRSKPMPGVILASVGRRLSEAQVAELRGSLLGLPKSAGGAEVLRTMRLAGFRELDPTALDRVRRALAR